MKAMVMTLKCHFCSQHIEEGKIRDGFFVQERERERENAGAQRVSHSGNVIFPPSIM